jgi:hypothetical protein
MLDVAGDINTTGEIRRNGSAYNHPDYVFEPDYELVSFADLKSYVAENRHLPGMPSAKEVREEGIKLFEQNRLVLEKLEEAYLYILKLEERISQLEDSQKEPDQASFPFLLPERTEKQLPDRRSDR